MANDDTAERVRPTARPAREPLSRDQIIDAAITSVDERGLQALTMRSLGQRLGVEAMSLYRYVNGREDLLEGMVGRLIQELRVVDARGDDLLPVDGWQAYLQALAVGARRLAHAHPSLFPLIATRHPSAPWLRPPLRSLDVVEDFLVALISRGFSDESAVAAYRAFTSFLLGHLLLEVATLGGTTSTQVEEVLDEGGAEVPNNYLPLSDFPNTHRLQSQLEADHADAEFELALENLLDRLDALVSQ